MVLNANEHGEQMVKFGEISSKSMVENNIFSINIAF